MSKCLPVHKTMFGRTRTRPPARINTAKQVLIVAAPARTGGFSLPCFGWRFDSLVSLPYGDPNALKLGLGESAIVVPAHEQADSGICLLWLAMITALGAAQPRTHGTWEIFRTHKVRIGRCQSSCR